jgi:hypothetical protein
MKSIKLTHQQARRLAQRSGLTLKTVSDGRGIKRKLSTAANRSEFRGYRLTNPRTGKKYENLSFKGVEKIAYSIKPKRVPMSEEERYGKALKRSLEWKRNNKKRCKDQHEKWIKGNPDKIKEYKARDYQRHKDRYIAAANTRYVSKGDEIRGRLKMKYHTDQEYREVTRERSNGWYEKNPERASATRKKYKKDNPHIWLSDCHRRRANKRRARYCSKEEEKRFASTRPSPTHQWGHLIPLKAMGYIGSKRVQVASGLHTPANWAWQTEEDNLRIHCDLERALEWIRETEDCTRTRHLLDGSVS